MVRRPVLSGISKRVSRYRTQEVCPWNRRFPREVAAVRGEADAGEPYAAVAWPPDEAGDPPLPSLHGPDLVEFTLWGAKISVRLTDFYRLWRTENGAWTQVFPEIGSPALDAYMLQLDELVAMLDGKPHALPGFAAALDVQAVVEAILAAG